MILLITPQEITEQSIISGNVDYNKYLYVIENSQTLYLEPILGADLYDKILTDFEAETLAGDYETLYTDYIKPILKYVSVANFITVANYQVGNSGVFKFTGESKETVSDAECKVLAQNYFSMADVFKEKMIKFLCDNPITEYKNNAKGKTLKGGWYL
jgi:hypothetical protein